MRPSAVCKAVADYKCFMSFSAYERLFGETGANAYFIKGELPSYDDSPESRFFYVSFPDIPVLLITVFVLATAVIGRLIASRGQIRLLPEE